MKDLEESLPTKIIRVTDCMECPIIKTCKAWKGLTKQQRVFMMINKIE